MPLPLRTVTTAADAPAVTTAADAPAVDAPAVEMGDSLARLSLSPSLGLGRVVASQICSYSS